MKTCRKEREREKKALSESRLSRCLIHRAGNHTHTHTHLYSYICAHFHLNTKPGKGPVAWALLWKYSHQDPQSGCGRLPNVDLVCLVAARLLTRVINATQKSRFHSIRDDFSLRLNLFFRKMWIHSRKVVGSIPRAAHVHQRLGCSMCQRGQGHRSSYSKIIIPMK